MKNEIKLGLALLLFGVVACEPVIAIGWKEFFFVFLLMTFLFGPPVYRFIRRLEELRKHKDK